MGNEVVLVGRAELEGIHNSLKKIMEHSKQANQEVGNMGKRTEDILGKTVKKTETSIKGTGSILRRLASQLYSDFKGLLALQSLVGGLRLANQFSGSVKESLKLNDSVRRLGNSFGIAKSDFGKFQASLARGLGDIGASSEAASAALEGLAGFGVKGIDSAKNLTKGAVTLAGVGGEKGNEKQIASLLAGAIQSQGKDVNDMPAQQKLIGEVTAAVTATGKGASEILGAMNEIFSTMPQELRKSIGPEAMAQIATMATTAGPAATKALQEYLSKSTEQRMAMEAQGFNVFKGGKIDMGALNKFIKTTEQRGLSPRESLKTAGFSDEAAEGLVRLSEKSKLVEENLAKLAGASRDNEKAFRDTMGLVDSFKGSINTVKGWAESTFKGVSQTITEILSRQVGHAGAAAVVVGGAAIAATAAGFGIKKISEMLLGKTVGGQLGGLYKGKAAEMLTGKEVQPVYVVNADEISAGGAAEKTAGLLAGAGGMKGMLGKAGGAAIAGAAGYELGTQVLNPLIDKFTQGTTDEGYSGNAVERFFAKLDAWTGGAISGTDANTKPMRVLVETKDPSLRVKNEPSRGPSQ